MRDAVRVRVNESLAHCHGDARGLRLGQALRRRASQTRPERLARKQFHDDEPGAALAIEVVKTDDVRVRNRLCLPEFPLQARDVLRPVAQFRAQQLDRDAMAVS